MTAPLIRRARLLAMLALVACASSSPPPAEPVPGAPAASGNQPSSPVDMPPPTSGEAPGKATANWNELLSPTMANLKRTSFGQYSPDVLDAVVKPDVLRDYRLCGVQSAADAEYGKEYVFIADMGTTLGAMCMMAREKTLDGKPIGSYDGPQSEGYTRPGKTFVRKGRFYIYLKGANESFGGGSNTPKLTTELMRKLPDASKPDPEIERLSRLPMIGRIPGSTRYLLRDIFSFASMSRGFSADYGCGEVPLGLARIHLQGGQAASMMEAVEREAKGKGYSSSAGAYGERTVLLKKAGQPSLYLIAVGTELGVAEIDGNPAECDHVLREFVTVLHKP